MRIQNTRAAAALLAVACGAGLAGQGLAQDPGSPAEQPPEQERLLLAGRALQRVEVQANVHTGSTQELAALDRDAAGGSVLVWQSKRQEPDGSYGIYARRFDGAGAPSSGEVHVNLRTEGAQYRPAVGLAPSGAAWFAWESYGQDGDLGGVVLRRFDPALAAGTNEQLVDTVRDGHQAEPAVAVDAAGRALVVWTGPGALAGTRVVRARRFAADAAPLGEPFVLSAAEAARDGLPTVAADPAGGFQVAWARTDLDGRPSAIVLRGVDREGAAAEAEQVVVEGPCVEPALDVDEKGRVLVAWMSGAGADYAPELCWVSGGELGPVRRLDPGRPGHASGLGVACLDDGSALAAWSRFGDEQKSAGLFLQPLDGQLNPLGEALRATESRAGNQRLGVGGPRRLAAAEGSLALCWDGQGPGGDASGVDLTLLVDAALSPALLAARAAPADPVDLREEGAGPHEPPLFTGPVDPAARAQESSLFGPDYGFAGIAMTALTPPDPEIAAGPDHVLCIVNGELAFHDKDGTQTFSSPLDGPSGFFASLGAANGFIFDPETLYDPHTGRFMLMANERNGNAFFLLAVSDDSDPNGTWFKYRFDVTAAAGDTDIDSPNFAVDDEVVYLTADFFGPDKFLVYMVEKAPLLVGAGNPITRSLLITGSQSYGVPVTYDAAAPAQYMLEAFESFSNTAVRFHAITDALGAPQRQTFDLTVPTYVQPEDPPQLGTTVRPNTFESRFWSCVYRNGSLWATHHVNSTLVRQRWYEFAMNGWPASGQTPTLAQWGEILPAESVRTFFGSISVDDQGNAGMIFARSSPSEFISMARAFRQVGNPPGSMTPAVTMQTSDGPDTSGRWGDYSGVDPDPFAPGAFWGYHEYRQGGIWRTWVGLMGPCQAPLPYCTAKLTSLGTTPSVGWTGEPSVSVDDFHLTMTGGLPGKNGLAFWGLAPAANPFLGGLKCVANPVKRTPLFTLDNAGSVSLPVPVTLDDLGVTRYYQFWFRDPLHPDGTTAGLSDGLEFTFCP